MNKAEILVIDEEAPIRKLLAVTLGNTYKVSEAETGAAGIKLAMNCPPELILLNVGLPDMSGHEVLKELRAWYNKSIIMLSALDYEKDVVQALDNGATDCLTKPFRNAELQARIRAAIRRNQPANCESKMVFDELEIDAGARTVKRRGETLKLTSAEYNLLLLFAKNEGRVITHQHLLKEMWGADATRSNPIPARICGRVAEENRKRPQSPQAHYHQKRRRLSV